MGLRFCFNSHPCQMQLVKIVIAHQLETIDASKHIFAMKNVTSWNWSLNAGWHDNV